LDVEEPGSWAQLTGFLSRKGYEFSAVSLYPCSDFAKGLGVTMPDDMWASSFEDEDLLMDRKTLLVGDSSTLEYDEMLKWTFEERCSPWQNPARDRHVSKLLAVYPVELLYFGPVSQHGIDEMEVYFRGSRKFHNEVTRIKTSIITHNFTKPSLRSKHPSLVLYMRLTGVAATSETQSLSG
ncbi:uncharacterized protein LOC124253814, partial [Haliotis rubra]|uniref:uncharacterized protein LOC124253814 n=1 Tax=Haliotis rubra TaxID=36100 RepID=UPI001EE63552